VELLVKVALEAMEAPAQECSAAEVFSAMMTLARRAVSYARERQENMEPIERAVMQILGDIPNRGPVQ
jgi:hypothetical protein